MKPKWGDFALAGIVLVASLILSYKIIFTEPGNAPTAVITIDGAVVEEIILYPDLERKVIPLKDGHILIEAENGRMRFTESDCKNQICVNTGWIGTPGQIAACLPNRTLIKITGDEDGLDVVVQ